jgi:D-alanyl-D-alanine carboxypeptidase/D-alanyl-D-alanine-endopeptidase (penicillin-binding protein 4)
MRQLRLVFLLLASSVFTACSVSHQLQRSAQKLVLNDPALQTAHVGISIYEPATGKWWYNWQDDKYFVPASNTKLATCYAAMKYLGDSLVAARLMVASDNVVELSPSGDPTFLNNEFPHQPLYEIIKSEKWWRLNLTRWREERWGSGWSWNDYNAPYMAERSPFPMYGNLFHTSMKEDTIKIHPAAETIWFTLPDSLQYNPEFRTIKSRNFRLERFLDKNDFRLVRADEKFASTAFPIRTDVRSLERILKDTLHADNISTVSDTTDFRNNPRVTVIHSQPTDSLLRPMMHRSDNFFAEQSLLMVSNEMLGFMNDEKIIDTILKTDFKDLPQPPRWVDGSGLSRYNLFTPQDFVAILGKMKAEFGMERLRNILPTGNEGTLTGYYKADSAALYAKTGTLSGVVALSGFLTTQRGKELIFSVLVNNHRASATQVRRAVERFVHGLKNRY